MAHHGASLFDLCLLTPSLTCRKSSGQTPDGIDLLLINFNFNINNYY